MQNKQRVFICIVKTAVYLPICFARVSIFSKTNYIFNDLWNASSNINSGISSKLWCYLIDHWLWSGYPLLAQIGPY